MIRVEAEVAELPTDPGARLRRQRELGGLTEQQVGERLNLDAVVVAALEAGDYGALGAPVFVRGHLRRYAAQLGLSGDEILGAYDRSRAQLAPPTLVPKSREDRPPARGRLASPRLVGGGALALLVAAGVAAYVVVSGLCLPGGVDACGADVAMRSPTLTERIPSTRNPLSAPAGTEGVAPVATASQGGSAATVVQPGQVALVFEFHSDSWIEVYDGSGRTVLYDLGKAGTQRAVAGVAPLSVTLGNAPAVGLLVNGRRMAVPSPPQGETVARFGVGRDGPQS